MKRITLFVLILFLFTLGVILTYGKADTYLYEAEELDGSYVIVNDSTASGEKIIGIDFTLNEEKSNRYYLTIDNMPNTTGIRITYATAAWGELVVYLESSEHTKALCSIPFVNTGGWYADTTEIAEVEGIYIPEGSRISIYSTGSVNIDYIELSYDEKSIPEIKDGKQNENVQHLNNVFLSTLNWKSSACNEQEFLFSVHRDRTPTFEPLSIADKVYGYGLSMLSGHYPGSVYVDINIESLGFTTFASYVGVSDVTSAELAEPSIEFVVEVDGVEKARSQIMHKGDEAELLTADITNGKLLRIYVTPADDAIGVDCAVWGNAALGKSSQIEEIFQTPSPEPTTEPTTTPKDSNTPLKTQSTSNTNEIKQTKYIWIIIGISTLVIFAIIIFIIKKMRKRL